MEKNNEVSDQSKLSQFVIPQHLLERVLADCTSSAVIFNEQGKVLYFNKAFQGLCGFSEELILNSSLAEFFPFMGDFKVIVNNIRNGLTYQIPPSDYFFSNMRSGKLRGSIIPFVYEGELKYAIGLFQDIKDIDLLEVKISEHNSILREIEKLSNIGEWEANLKTGTSIWSEGMYRIFDIPLGSISKGDEFFNYIHPDDKKKIHKVIEDVISLKSTLDFDFRIYTPSNELKYVNGRVQPVLDEQGEVIRFLGYCQDITQSKEIINELKHTQSFLLQSQAAARVGSFEWAVELQKFRASAEFYNLFEFDIRDEIDFKKILDRIDPADSARVYNCIQSSIKNLVSCECYFRVILPSGKELFCLCRAELVEDNINNSTKFIGSIADITERRTAEIKLEEANLKLEEKTNDLKKLNDELENKVDERAHEVFVSNERFRLVSEATQEAMWDWDLVNKTIWCNEAFKRNFGMPDSNKASQFEIWKSRIHPDDSERLLHSIFTAINSEVTQWKDEYRFLRMDGRYIFAMDRGFIIRNKEGKAIRMVGSMMEVSKINQIERRLKESEENYRFLAESMPQLLWISNARGGFIYANRRWTEYTGQDYISYKDFGWKRCIHPDDLNEVMKIWNDVPDPDKEFNMQYRIISKDCETRWFLSRAIPMLDEEGKIERWVGTSTDIHDQKQLADNLVRTQEKLNYANQNLYKKNKRLKHINKDLDNFIYSATHDLRSPVGNMESLLRLLYSEATEQKCSEKFQDYFNLVFKSLDILKVILNDLTEVVKADDQPGVAENISFADMINEVKVMLHEPIQSSGVKINIDLDIPDVKFLRKNLRSIFYNIISNAIKYRARERSLEIGIKTEHSNGQYTLLSISDNGIGIKKQDIEKVFLPFKRINYDIEGTGIGMWIMKRIIENNGGKIEVESEVDKGTIFRIYFKN
jgi:PAS domain S-box-containing protein